MTAAEIQSRLAALVEQMKAKGVKGNTGLPDPMAFLSVSPHLLHLYLDTHRLSDRAPEGKCFVGKTFESVIADAEAFVADFPVREASA